MAKTDRRIIFWFDDIILEKYLSKYPIDQRNEIAKNLFIDFVNGKNTQTIQSEKKQSSNDVDQDLKRMKLRHETLKVWEKFRNQGYSWEQFEAFMQKNEIPAYPESTSTDYTKTEQEEKPKVEFKSYGTTITHKPKKILQEDGTLRCMRCNKKIEMRAFDFEQLDDYRKHVESSHGSLYESERKELMEIYPN